MKYPTKMRFQGGAPWVLRLEFDSNCMESVRASLRELCGILLVNTLGDVHIINNTLSVLMTMVYASKGD